MRYKMGTHADFSFNILMTDEIVCLFFVFLTFLFHLKNGQNFGESFSFRKNSEKLLIVFFQRTRNRHKQQQRNWFCDTQRPLPRLKIQNYRILQRIFASAEIHFECVKIRPRQLIKKTQSNARIARKSRRIQMRIEKSSQFWCRPRVNSAFVCHSAIAWEISLNKIHHFLFLSFGIFVCHFARRENFSLQKLYRRRRRCRRRHRHQQRTDHHHKTSVVIVVIVKGKVRKCAVEIVVMSVCEIVYICTSVSVFEC